MCDDQTRSLSARLIALDASLTSTCNTWFELGICSFYEYLALINRYDDGHVRAYDFTILLYHLGVEARPKLSQRDVLYLWGLRWCFIDKGFIDE